MQTINISVVVLLLIAGCTGSSAGTTDADQCCAASDTVTTSTATGKTGATGPAGAAGAEGTQGPAGPAGAAGTQGPRGVPGPAGAEGPAGPVGEQGPQGDQGLPGATGSAGQTGPRGLTGLPGATGAAGAAGADGVLSSRAGVYAVTENTLLVPANQSATFTITCKTATDILLNGGCAGGGNGFGTGVTGSYPQSDETLSSWVCAGQNSSSAPFYMSAYITCIAVP